MDRFKDGLRARDLYGDDAVIPALPPDDPNVTPASSCRYDVCAVMAADQMPVSEEVRAG